MKEVAAPKVGLSRSLFSSEQLDSLFSLSGFLELVLMAAVLALLLGLLSLAVRFLWGLGFDRARRFRWLLSGARLLGGLLLGYWLVVRAVHSLPVLSVVFITLVAGAVLYSLLEPLQSVVAALAFIWRSRIQPGDEVTVGGLTGVVRELSLLQMSLQQRDGSLAWVPNRLVHRQGMVLRARWNAVPFSFEWQSPRTPSQDELRQLKDWVLLCPYRSPGSEVTVTVVDSKVRIQWVLWSSECRSEGEAYLRRSLERLIVVKS